MPVPEVWNPFDDEKPRRRRWRRWAVAAALLAGTGMAVGVALYMRTTLPDAPALLPAGTPLFAAVTPGPSALVGLPLLRRAYPNAVSTDGWDEAARELEQRLGVKLGSDVLPWLGPEMAMALVPVEAGEVQPAAHKPPAGPVPVALFADRDPNAARACLAKIRAHRAAKGERAEIGRHADADFDRYPDGSTLGLVGSFVVYAGDERAFDAVADQAAHGREGSLAEDADYRAVVARLAPQAAARLVVRNAGLDGLRGSMPEAMPTLPGTLPTAGWRTAGAAVVLHRQAVSCESVVRFDAARWTPEQRATATELARPTDPALLAGLPAGVVAGLSFRLPAGTPALLQPLLPPSARTAIPGVDPGRDIVPWLEGEVALGGLAPAEDPRLLDLDGVMALRPRDPDRAREGLEHLSQAFGAAGRLAPYAFVPRERDGETWQVLHERLGGRDLGGYGFHGNTLWLALGPRALAAAGQGPTLGGAKRFRTGTAGLPRPNAGVMYLDVHTCWHGFATLLPALATPQARAAFAPLGTVAAAGSPGIDAAGFAHGRAILTLEEPPPPAPGAGAPSE